MLEYGEENMTMMVKPKFEDMIMPIALYVSERDEMTVIIVILVIIVIHKLNKSTDLHQLTYSA